MQRDFTYIDDIVEGVVRVLDDVANPAASFDRRDPDPATSDAPYRIFNIGNHHPVDLMTYIETIEQVLGRTAKKNFLPLQAGDVLATYADISELAAATGFSPGTPIETGVRRFVDWYLGFHSGADTGRG